MVGKLIGTMVLAGTVSVVAHAQQPPVPATPPVATFRSSVDLVRVTAVVRDRRGRLVRDMTARDFEVREGAEVRRIKEFRRDQSGVSVSFLFDVSGSMASQLANARDVAEQVMGVLTFESDEAAVFTFDTRLDEVTPFTAGLRRLPERLATVRPFGATSLHDAVARTAEKTSTRDGLRRAVVVLTDGFDNASRLTAGEVSGIASAIDVPVYIVGLVPAIDNPSADIAAMPGGRSALSGALSDLALWTGGQAFIVSTSAERAQIAQTIVEELRHQYLIAFESSERPGWHPLEVRVRSKDLTVRARSGYISGQSRPISD